MGTGERDRVVLVGTTSRPYREYLLREIARDVDLWLLAERAPTWERRYLVGHTELDIGDVDALHAAARAVGPDGILTWDESLVVATAEVAERLGLPGTPPDAVRACRDKHATRAALAAAGAGPVASTLVHSLAQARAAAAAIGYPVVLKPRDLNGSLGVVRVDGPHQLAARFRTTRGAGGPGASPGVLVEEYLDGPEVSVDVAWQEGVPELAFVARKELGFPPYFEETGHLVDGSDPMLDDDELRTVVFGAHAAVGFRTGWTHTEVRRTPAGYRIVEINARLGGDLIPRVGRLALGVEAGTVAARIACGRPPGLAVSHRRVAAVRFLYPPRDLIVRSVAVGRDGLPSTVDSVETVAMPGQQLRLPPAGHVSGRYALVTAVAADIAGCRAALDAGAAAVTLTDLEEGRTQPPDLRHPA